MCLKAQIKQPKKAMTGNAIIVPQKNISSPQNYPRIEQTALERSVFIITEGFKYRLHRHLIDTF